MRAFRNIFFAMSLLAGCFALLPAMAGEKRVEVGNTCIPVMTDCANNVVSEICIDNSDGTLSLLDGVEVTLGGVPLEAVRSMRLVYTGTMSARPARSDSWAMKDLFKRIGGNQILISDPSYVFEQGVVQTPNSPMVWLPAKQKLVRGRNYFYVSIDANVEKIEMSNPFSLAIARVVIGGQSIDFKQTGPVEHRWGVAVRRHGDDGVYAYRIPGLVTTNQGTLLGVYDVRHHTSLDLQDDIDIGVSRSTDGGHTWEPMRIIMDMGRWGGLPEAQNGIGDPAILVDEQTGEIFVVAAWTHGLGNGRAWTEVGTGYDPLVTAQLMLTSSKDDGLTWSEPRNITRQVKQSHWAFTLQGPGRGISMQDGTLVFPIQYIDSLRVPNAGIMYSTDHGQSWQCHGHAHTNTTESQVAEVAPGRLMLNMRDNRKTGRAVFTTNDMGRTWVQHPSSGVLREPVCMASLLHVPASQNILKRDVLLFANPDTTKGRNHLTIKASLDGGDTWLADNSLLLDEEENWGYSCLTMIDPQTIGILYEGSTAQMVFQTVKLRDVVRDTTVLFGWQPLREVTPAQTDYAKGVSALYAGAVKGDLMMAGGANYSAISAADGGAKVYYGDIWMMRNCAGKNPVWRAAGRLPEASAYGVSYALPGELIIAGGANATGALRGVYSLRPRGDRVAVTRLGELPFAVEQAAGGVADGVLYLAGGLVEGKPSCEVLAYDTKSGSRTWRRIASLPEPFVQPVMAVAEGALYVWGGFDSELKTVADYGYRYDLATQKWERIAGIPDKGTMTGATALSLDNGRILVMGGVDRTIFTNALQLEPEKRNQYLSQPPAAYRFRSAVYVFDAPSGNWTKTTVSGLTARAGAALAVCDGATFLIGGEVKPGVRTPAVWRFPLADVR